MKLLIVIVNYRTDRLTIDCLRSLELEMRAMESLGGAQVVITDNASGDGSAEKIACAIAAHGWTWARMMPLSTNGGFAAGNNAAIREALALPAEERPEFIYLLNPDTLALPGAVTELVQFMAQHPACGIAGGRSEHRDGSAMHSVFQFPTPLSELEGSARVGVITKLMPRHVVAPPLPAATQQAEWISGASMMVRTSLFEQVGLLDEGYFMYFEETEFCLRAHRAGHECWFVPASRIIHLVGQSSGITGEQRKQKRRPRYWFASRHRFFKQSYGSASAFAADLNWLIGAAAYRVLQAVGVKPRVDPPWMMWDFLRYNAQFWLR